MDSSFDLFGIEVPKSAESLWCTTGFQKGGVREEGYWHSPGFVDTEIGPRMGLEVCDGEQAETV